MTGRRTIRIIVALSGLIVSSLAQAQQATQFAGPSGNFIIQVTNDSGSAVPLQNVVVDYVGGPSFLHVPQSVGPVTSVAVGAESDFTFPYTIDSGAPDGVYTATFTVVPQDTPNSESPDGSLNTSVNIPIGWPHFLVGAQLRGVSQEAVREGLKFSAGSLLYRQAGRQALRADIKEGAAAPVAQPIEPLSYREEGRWFKSGVRNELATFASRCGSLAFRWSNSLCGPGAQPRLSGQKQRSIRRFYRPLLARKVMSQARQAQSLAAFARGASFLDASDLKVPQGRKAHKLEVAAASQRLAKPPPYRPQGGKAAVCSARSQKGLEPAPFQFTPSRPRDPLAGLRVFARLTARGSFAGCPSCLKILGGSLARAYALLFAVARAEGAQDRGDIGGKLAPS
jgi:hypothetical protein